RHTLVPRAAPVPVLAELLPSATSTNGTPSSAPITRAVPPERRLKITLFGCVDARRTHADQVHEPPAVHSSAGAAGIVTGEPPVRRPPAIRAPWERMPAFSAVF